MGWLNETEISRVVYEPTGSNHRDLERPLVQVGPPLVKVNPRQARRFAEATGKLAKTDRTDALMLARMGIALEPDVRPIFSQSLRELKELNLTRQALIKDRAAARNRKKTLTCPS